MNPWHKSQSESKGPGARTPVIQVLSHVSRTRSGAMVQGQDEVDEVDEVDAQASAKGENPTFPVFSFCSNLPQIR